MANTVLLQVIDGVATLTLNRPEVLNTISVEMMEDLAKAVAELKRDTSVEVIVLEGAGDHFMAGGDIKDFEKHLDLSAPARLATFKAMIEHHINPTMITLQGMHQPVIAKVRGACAGFGLSFMLGCDLAIAADNAKFTAAYANIGLPADGGMSYFLPRMIGRRRTLELLMLAERFDAAEAHRLGLVTEVVPAADLDEAVASLVRRLKTGARHAYGEIKRLTNASLEAPFETQLQSEAEAFARCAASEDFAEGVRAFLGKRKPAFKGR